jgi:putative colanic acid biosynthesis acetyltransferase WcaF
MVPEDSPWSLGCRVRTLIWEYTWMFLCSWTPKPANRWRLAFLKAFGARIYGRPFVHSRARILMPWNVTLHDHSCVGDRANLYSLDEIEIHEYATVAQEAYLCTATHAFDRDALNLVTAKIIIASFCFVGARAFVFPGIRIGERAIVGACSVVTRDVEARRVVAGNPAKVIGIRP